MTTEYALRAIVGTFILISLALAVWVSPYWLWFTALIGVSLLQSAFTHWCPMEKILRKAGLKSAGAVCGGIRNADQE